MTGNVDPESVESFQRAGFSALLAKPFGEVRACTRAPPPSHLTGLAVSARRVRARQDDLRRLLEHLRAGRGGWWSSMNLPAAAAAARRLSVAPIRPIGLEDCKE
jgi:hypothetical protein